MPGCPGLGRRDRAGTVAPAVSFAWVAEEKHGHRLPRPEALAAFGRQVLGYPAVFRNERLTQWYSTVAVLGPGPDGLLTGIAPVSAALSGVITGSQVPGPLVWLGMLVVIGGW